jgi:hypothetical protein
MNRLELREQTLKEDISIYDVCLMLKMSQDGSSDPLSDNDRVKYFRYLVTVKDTWEEPTNIFDYAVKNLIISTLFYCHYYK